MTIVEFLGGMFGTRSVEIAAALCGLVNVVLIIRRSLWNYPFGFAMVTLYAGIFFEAKLYSDALLQVYFFVIQIFGLIWWLRGTDSDGLVQARNLSVRQATSWALAAAIGTAGLGRFMATQTDAALPFWDAATTILSIVAQTLMARRYQQSWLVWIVVDVIAIGIYTAKDLLPTVVLYSIFLGLAVQGWLSWRGNAKLGETAQT